MRPHIQDHPPALRVFKNRIELGAGPRNAVMAACAAGAWPSPEWLRANYSPIHDVVAKLEAGGDLRGAVAFKTDHLLEFQQEAAALALAELKRSWAETTSLADDERRAADERERARIRRRDEYVGARAVALFDAWIAGKREEFRLEALAEFEALQPAAGSTEPATVVTSIAQSPKLKRQQPKNEPPTAA